MQCFTVMTGVAAPMPAINVDTDAIIPKRFMKTIKRVGLGVGLFADARFLEDGSENPQFVFNRPKFRQASILVAGDNFGCGSSREHAQWAISDFWIRCIISTSFGDIFFQNCFQNGILPIVLGRSDVGKLMAYAESVDNPVLTVDLPRQSISNQSGTLIDFDVDPFRKQCMLEGLDEVGSTLKKLDQIEIFESVKHHAL